MTAILFILLLSLIVVIHEFGHLIAAKIFKVYCGEFSLGMGPKIISYKAKETEYSLRLLPIGGFVSMAGDVENDLETTTNIDVPKERTLLGIAAWKKAIIMLAGIFMNIVLAFVIVCSILLYNGAYATAPNTTLDVVAENSAAYNAGLRANDTVYKLEYKDLNISYEPRQFYEMQTFMIGHEEETITFYVHRGNEDLSFDVKPILDEESGRYLFGISSTSGDVIDINLLNVLPCAADYLMYVTRTIFMSLGQLIRGIGLQNLSGPVGVYQATSEAVAMGPEMYFMMIAIFSLNVGIFNALPLPILDGGRVILLIVEAIKGKPLSQKATNFLMSASMLILLGIVLIATYQDIIRLFV